MGCDHFPLFAIQDQDTWLSSFKKPFVVDFDPILQRLSQMGNAKERFIAHFLNS